ncbi:hypothetical protein KUTeg_004943 [Tegillarca granosa]|uniref:RRP12-like protein n=1 Tax=Tegillarca granosa TaxID=220873 RepID=A0ABQ9FIE6_TEGGR|nr:hypothetical protein KUTeg_004943 [Tegillarca granosa]
MGTKSKHSRTLPRNTKTKGKKWKKGQSSSCNPETKRFREAAKNRFFHQQNQGQSNLTVDALAKHDATNVEKDGDVILSDPDFDVQTAGGSTFKTWATNWTECTNATFSRMTALETTTSTESLTAIMYLISLAIKRVSPTVLRSRFSEVAKLFLDVMATHSDGDCTSLLKSLILSLASLLRVQEQAVWKNSSTQRIYTGLLTFVTHKKPKIRKAAHQGVCVVLRGSLFMTQGANPPHHPAASMTAKYCIQQIEDCGGTGEALVTLHTLALLKDSIGLFPSNSVKSTCETILRLMTLSNVALYDYQPAENDVQPMQAWLVVMEKAHVNLSKIEDKLCISHLPRITSTAMTCLLSEKTEIKSVAVKVIKVLLKDCLEPSIDSLKVLIDSAPDGALTPLHKIVKAVESGLSYQFYSSWGLVLQLFGVLYEVCGKQCPKIFKKSLQSIANLRDSPKFPHKPELDHVFGCAIKTMGPRFVLEAVPLNITGENDDYNFPRSWIIPVIRDNVSNTELGFFTSYFLPLAATLRQRCIEFEQSGNIAVYKSYEALQLQIWSLLPGFCTKPTDLAQSFKGIAKVLGSAISDRPDLRMDVMSSLRKLIMKAREKLVDFLRIFCPYYLIYLQRIKIKTKIHETCCLVSSFCDKCLEKQREDNRTLQKKSYRILEEICSGSSESEKEFVREHLPEIQNPRLRCLFHIFKQLDSRQQDFLISVVPEAILCTKEVAERARTAAYNLLVEMGQSQIRWASESDKKGNNS